MKQRDIFWICNIQYAYDKHRVCHNMTNREIQTNERQKRTGRRGNVDRQEANPYCPSARKCRSQQLAGVGGGSVTLSNGCQSQLTASALHRSGAPSVLGCITALTPYTDLRLLAAYPTLAPLLCPVTNSCVLYTYFGLIQGAAKSSTARRADRFLQSTEWR